MKNIFLIFFLFLMVIHSVNGQENEDNTMKPVQFSLNEAGDHYVRVTGLAQIWLRNTSMNPGSTIFGTPEDNYTEISIRRLRFQVYGQLTDKVFFYTQFGMNNFNYHSAKFAGAFFHDALVEYRIAGEKLSLGGGLTAWGGTLRYSTPSIGSIMTLDAPLFLQATNGVNDQFLRKLSVYAKGQLGRLDYRMVLSQPMEVIGLQDDSEPSGPNFTFSGEAPSKQFHGYFRYMFMDKESNLTPYQAGTYLGEKSVFNIGAGFIHQPEATWAEDGSGATIFEDMTIIGLDVFVDKPVGDTGALTAYAGYTHANYGDGYIRYLGVNNAATGGGLPSERGSFGNAFPMHGSGSTFYAQAGFLFGEDLLTRNGKLQPFASLQLSDYDRIDGNMAMYELGFNFLVHGTHNGKISFMYQSRPVFTEQDNNLVFDARKGMAVLQVQAGF